MRNLILGSSGFIGKNLVKELSKTEKEIRVFDLNPLKEHEEISECKIEFIQGEFSPDYDFDELTKGIDVVYHLISTTIPSSSISLVKEIEENVFSTLKLLDACVKNGVKKIIYISSGGTVYGQSNGLPFRENDNTNPICSYGIQKLTIEKYIQLYNKMYELDYRIVRLSNPYGIGQNPNGGLGAVTTFTYRIVNNEPIVIYGDGEVVRDYIYIDDAIKSIVNIALYEGKYKVFNVGSGKGYSLNQIVETIEKVVGKKFNVIREPARKVDVPYSVLDISRLINTFPERHTTSLCEGVKVLSDFYIKEE